MSDEIRATLRTLSDRELLAEWDKTSDMEPPDYTLEGLIDAEMSRRVAFETDSAQLLSHKLYVDDLKAALKEIRRMASRVDCDRWRIIHLAQQALGWCEDLGDPSNDAP